MYILRDPLVDVAWPEPLLPGSHTPTLAWWVATHDQCARAAEQARLRIKWVVVQVSAGRPRPRGLPRRTILLVATALPHDPYRAMHPLEDQSEDTGHLVVHQRLGAAWLVERLTALRSWASTVTRAKIWLNNRPPTCPNDTHALGVDQLAPRHPDVKWYSPALNAGWLSLTRY